MKIGRTDPCHCGSGKRYKNCCRDKDEAAEAATAAAAAAANPPPAPDAEPAAAAPPPPQGTAFKKGTGGQTPAFPKVPPPPRTKMMRKRAV